MTILALAQQAARRLQITAPSSLVGSANNQYILLLAMINQAAQDLAATYPWPELEMEHTFTLSDGVDSYALAGDFDRIRMETLWNRDEEWPLLGPLDAVEWQQYKSGLITSFPRQRFRIKGRTDTQFFLDPTPDSTSAGQTCAYEYLSDSVFRPKTWSATTIFAAGAYCFYDGNIYQTTAGGTTGSTAPTHTSGDDTDGGVTWTYYSATYDTVIADTDESILNEGMVLDWAIWMFRRETGLSYQHLMKDAQEQVAFAKTKKTGGEVLSYRMGRGRFPDMIGPWSYPEGDY